MLLYGLYGFTHGWGRLLTVMSPEGAAAVVEHVAVVEGIEIKGGEGARSSTTRSGAVRLRSWSNATASSCSRKLPGTRRSASLARRSYERQPHVFRAIAALAMTLQ